MKTQKLLVALSLMVMLAACGKSMSLRVNGNTTGAQNTVPGTIDASKVAQSNICTPNVGTTPVTGALSAPKTLDVNESLQEYSAFDINELKATLPASALLKRSTLQIPPKNSVTKVLKLDLVLNNADIQDASKASICIVETECRSLSDFITKATAAVAPEKAVKFELDLREVFGLTQKSDAEVMDWIYANSTEYARPGYRKFRFDFEGISSLESGAVILQVITNEKLPVDFATQPTCYEHGDTDTVESTPAATTASDTGTSTTTNTATGTSTSTASTTATDTGTDTNTSTTVNTATN